MKTIKNNLLFILTLSLFSTLSTFSVFADDNAECLKACENLTSKERCISACRDKCVKGCTDKYKRDKDLKSFSSCFVKCPEATSKATTEATK